VIKKQTYDGRVKRAVKREQDRWGFIDYYGAARVTAKVHDVLDRADSFLEQGRTVEAIWIYQAVIEGVVPAMAHADDSAGILSGTINYACEGLRRAAEGATEQEKEELFAYCVRHAPLEPYMDWDWGWELAELAGELVRTAAERMTLFAALDKMAGRRDKGYGPEMAALIKLSVMRRMDDDTAVQGFMEEQIRHEKIRQALARFH